jgi:hypothetical protein
MPKSQDNNHPTRPADNHPARSINDTDHLVPQANRLLAVAGRAAWKGIRLLAGIVIRIPHLFVRANRRPRHIDPNH